MNIKNIQQKMQREKIKIEKMFTKEIQEQKEEIVKLEQEIENLDKVIADKNRAIEDINKNINEINAYLTKETERNNHEIEKLMSEQKENTEILNKELELIKQNYNDILEAVNHIRRRYPFPFIIHAGIKIHQISCKIGRHVIVNFIVKRIEPV